MPAPIAIRDRHPTPAERTRVMVCLSGEPGRDLVLRQKAVRELSAENRVWLVHVETATEAKRAGREGSLSFENTAAFAADIGAELAWLKSADEATALIDFAHSSKIDRIILHCSRRTLWNRWFRRSLVRQLIDRARGLQIEIVGLRCLGPQSSGRPRPEGTNPDHDPLGDLWISPRRVVPGFQGPPIRATRRRPRHRAAQGPRSLQER